MTLLFIFSTDNKIHPCLRHKKNWLTITTRIKASREILFEEKAAVAF